MKQYLRSMRWAFSFAPVLLMTDLAAAPRQITLEEAVATLLQQNFRVQIQEQETLIASDAIDSALGAFDPFIFVETAWEVVNRDQNALDFVSTGAFIEQRYWEDDIIRGRAGIGAKNSWGTEVELSVNLARARNTITRTNPTSIFDPEYQSFAGVTVRQPLLRNFGTKANRAQLRVAELELGVSFFEKEILISNQLVELINAFHDILYAQENLRVKRDALGLAETLLEDNRRRVELGRMSQLDVTQAQVQVSQAEEEVILAEDFLRDRRAAMARVMYGTPTADVLDFEVKGELSVPQISNMQVEALRRSALDQRPDYLLAIALKDQEEVRRHYARNQRLPELDLTLNYGLTGLANTTRNSFRRMEDLDTTQWSVGVVFNMPLGNRRGRAEVSAASRRVFQAELEMRRVEQQIEIDVRNAVERIATLERRLNTARRSVSLAEESLQVENRMLEEGRSTSFQVLQAQNSLSDARTRELAALVDMMKASIEVNVVAGRLLQQFGLSISSEYDSLANRDRRILRWPVR
ncbi:MAG: TolC family protein [Verrucomicrobia bacterium]|nr:TolC family protein [Verrucomicrobiota bacterium]